MSMEDNCGRPWNDPHPFGIPLKPKVRSLDQEIIPNKTDDKIRVSVRPTSARIKVDSPQVVSVNAFNTEDERLPAEAVRSNNKKHVSWSDETVTRLNENSGNSGCGICSVVHKLRHGVAGGLRSAHHGAARAAAACRHGALRFFHHRRRQPFYVPPGKPASSAAFFNCTDKCGLTSMHPRFVLDEDISPYGSVQVSPKASTGSGSGIFTGRPGGWNLPTGLIALHELDLTDVATTGKWRNHRSVDQLSHKDLNRPEAQSVAEEPKNHSAAATAVTAFSPGPEGHIYPGASSNPHLVVPTITVAAADAAVVQVTTSVVSTAPASSGNIMGVSGGTDGGSGGDSACCSPMMDRAPFLRMSSVDAASFWQALSSPTASIASPSLLSPATSLSSAAAAATATLLKASHPVPPVAPSAVVPPQAVMQAKDQAGCKLRVWEEGMPLLPYGLPFRGVGAPEAMS